MIVSKLFCDFPDEHTRPLSTSSPVERQVSPTDEMTRIPTMSRGATFCRNESAKRPDISFDIAPIKRTNTIFSIGGESTTESQFDTELELEDEEEEEEKKKSSSDRYGCLAYLDTCARLDIIPMRNIMKGLETDTIKIHNRSMTSQDTHALCEALVLNRCVRSVSLEGNDLGDAGAGHLAELITSTVNIKEINVSNNNISCRGIDILLEALLDNKDIYRVNMSSNTIRESNAAMLVKVLETSTTLTRLNMSYNDFGDRSCKLLATALASNSALRVLNLSWNKIHTRGAIELFNGLKDNVFLKKFRFSMSGLADAGTVALSHCLQNNSTVTEVDVSYNRISDKGAGNVAKGLLVNDSLKKLIMHDNPMTSNGVMELLTALKRNPSSALKLVDVSPVPVDTATYELKRELCKLRPKLKIKHGARVTSRLITKVTKEKRTARKEPLVILKDYITSKGYRLIDFFKQFDKDGSGSIDKREFVAGIKSIDVPLSVSQINSLMNDLDKDGDGEIDFHELTCGEKELRLKERAKRTRQLTETSVDH